MEKAATVVNAKIGLSQINQLGVLQLEYLSILTRTVLHTHLGRRNLQTYRLTGLIYQFRDHCDSNTRIYELF